MTFLSKLILIIVIFDLLWWYHQTCMKEKKAQITNLRKYLWWQILNVALFFLFVCFIYVFIIIILNLRCPRQRRLIVIMPVSPSVNIPVIRSSLKEKLHWLVLENGWKQISELLLWPQNSLLAPSLNHPCFSLLLSILKLLGKSVSV